MSTTKKNAKIRPDMIGAVITTKKHPNPILVEDTQDCRDLCAQLQLDVFEPIAEKTAEKPAKPTQETK